MILSWSRNSRYILTGSKDWNVVVWDLASDRDPPRRRSTIRFDVPVISAYFHPKNRCILYPFDICDSDWRAHTQRSKIVLVLLSSGEVYIVDHRREYKGRYELMEVLDESDDEGQYNRSRCVKVAFSHCLRS